MKKIYKYELNDTDLEMPVGSEILCVQDQRGRPCVWAAVDESADYETRSFAVIQTGYEYPETAYKHIGTYQSGYESRAFHVFEFVGAKVV